MKRPEYRHVLRRRHRAVQFIFSLQAQRQLPGSDEPATRVNHVVHLEVRCRVHGGQDQALLQSQAGGVHELQEDGKALRVHFGVQADGTEGALLRVREYGVEEATAGHQYSFVSSETLAIQLDGDIGEDIPIPQAVEVKQNVTCMAGELYAAF